MRVSLACLMCAVCLPAWAGFDTEGWQWRYPLEVQDLDAGFVRLPIGESIFDTSRRSLADLRVLNADGELVPHILHWPGIKEATVVRWRRLSPLNASYQPGEYARVTLDFEKPARKNLVRVKLPGTNYRRRVLVEGSPDNAAWNVLAEDQWLVAVRDRGHRFALDTIDLPENDFRYLRVTVFNMPDDPEYVQVEHVESAFRDVQPASVLTPVPIQAMTQWVDEKTNETVLDLDLGFRSLPIVKMVFSVDAEHFHRGVLLRGRNTVAEENPYSMEGGFNTVARETPWLRACMGTLYRIHDQGRLSEHLVLEHVSAPYRYLQVRIANADNPPLKVGGIELWRRTASLVFEYGGRPPAGLLSGNPKAAAPRYDLSRSVRDLSTRDLPLVHASAPEALYAAVLPWTERHPVLIWLALLAVVLVMATVLGASLRGLRGTHEE